MTNPKMCFRCHAVDPKKLSDHAPDCPLVKEKSEKAKNISRIINRFRQKNAQGSHPGFSRVNKSGVCKRCGEKVSSLLTHLRKCAMTENSGLPPQP